MRNESRTPWRKRSQQRRVNDVGEDVGLTPPVTLTEGIIAEGCWMVLDRPKSRHGSGVVVVDEERRREGGRREVELQGGSAKFGSYPRGCLAAVRPSEAE